MQHPTLTLLSPAKNKEVARAAIQAGADAVYIGAPAFGARQAAGNSLEDLNEVVQYAHLYGVQVLVTLNTLLHDDEYPQAVSLARDLFRIGVDALIIQDMHLLDFDLPPIRLHASTQCDNRTPEQVKKLRDAGFKRVVLARELGIDEIRAIHEAVPDIELEAFVHGALCVSYSGRCYISEVLSGRSANRGACAQYCRMAYDLLDRNMNEVRDEQGLPIHQKYLLSLQDMDRSAYLGELVEAGVTTFKIEGRLKDADYVTNITAYYRDLLDGFREHCSSRTAVYSRSFAPNPAKTFHRGSTDYFLHGRTPHMANWDTPKSTGEYIGEVLETRGNTICVQLLPDVVLHNGDGLSMCDEGFNVNGVNGNVITINKRLPYLTTFHSTSLYRNFDTLFAKSLHSERRIPVDIVFRETPDCFELCYIPCSPTLAPCTLRVGEGLPFDEAINRERAVGIIKSQLSKLGDTPFTAREVQIESQAYFIPAGTLNEWRRKAISVLLQHAVASYKARAASQASPQASTSESPACPVGIRPLMVCKYCLLYESGHCRKTNPYPADKEPRYIRLRNHTVLHLTFDCARCQMMVDQ